MLNLDLNATPFTPDPGTPHRHNAQPRHQVHSRHHLSGIPELPTPASLNPETLELPLQADRSALFLSASASQSAPQPHRASPGPREGTVMPQTKPGGAAASAVWTAVASARGDGAVTPTAARAAGPWPGLRKSMLSVCAARACWG